MPHPTGVSNPTILKLHHLGSACVAYHDEQIRGAAPKSAQADETWSRNC